MFEVKNRKVIRRLSIRSFLANRTRNIIAVLAIVLTTILFTTLFTVVISVNYSTQQQTMRMVGGSAHGGFKYLTWEQVEQLSKHPLIKKCGYSVMLATPDQEPFTKRQVEMRYTNDEGARLYFSEPTTGTMPKKKNEIAMDTTVLDLLGVPHKVGETITLTYPLGDKMCTDSFILTGYWKTDPVAMASEVWLSKEYVLEKLQEIPNTKKSSNIIGSWSLDICFKNSKNIEGNLRRIAEDNGYTIDDSNSSNYLDTGVNWAYTDTHMENGERVQLIVGVVVGVLFTIFIGYLIIYNIFGISVLRDMHYYGLLKTIGTTKRQIKRIIRYQGILLSLIGIPLGLCAGFLLGNSFVKIIMAQFTTKTAYVTYNCWIFIGSAAFAFITVMISCSKPGRMAGKVSPIEAVRYSEGTLNTRKKEKNTTGGAKIYRMAIANVKRSKGKTILVVISLALSLVLFNGIYAFTSGFSMDKFLDKFIVSDYLLGSADYMKSNYRGMETCVSESFIQAVEAKGYTEQSGRVYCYDGLVQGYFGKEELTSYIGTNYSLPPEVITEIESMYSSGNKEAPYHIFLYGLDEYPLQKLDIIEGDIGKSMEDGKKGIIQIIFEDDYGKPNTSEIIRKIGDRITLHYVDDFDIEEDGTFIEKKSRDIEYEVIATAVMPGNMGIRHYGTPQFAMPSDEYIEETNDTSTLNYLIDADDSKKTDLDEFVQSYTTNVEKDMDYESAQSMANQFSGFKNMFLAVGGGVSLVIGVIGILNFVNAMLMSIASRKQEFAVLQSIGMTGKQLKKMLILEGLFYTITSVFLALIIGSIFNVTVLKATEQLLWFYHYQYSVNAILILTPVFLILGILLPIILYKNMVRKSVVDRLRISE